MSVAGLDGVDEFKSVRASYECETDKTLNSADRKQNASINMLL